MQSPLVLPVVIMQNILYFFIVSCRSALAFKKFYIEKNYNGYFQMLNQFNIKIIMYIAEEIKEKGIVKVENFLSLRSLIN